MPDTFLKSGFDFHDENNERLSNGYEISSLKDNSIFLSQNVIRNYYPFRKSNCRFNKKTGLPKCFKNFNYSEYNEYLNSW